MKAHIGALIIAVDPDGESGGTCDYCGKETRTIWGYLRADQQTIAAYVVQWTRNHPEHYPNIDLLIGTSGDDALEDKKLAAWQFNPAVNSFRLIDSASRPAAKSKLCNESLTREQVLADSAFKELTTSFLDAVWLDDPRLPEVRALGQNVAASDMGRNP